MSLELHPHRHHSLPRQSRGGKLAVQGVLYLGFNLRDLLHVSTRSPVQTRTLIFRYAYFMIWETKGLTLEQVDRMMEETGSPRRSAGWTPHSTFAHDMGMDQSKAAIGQTVHGEEKAQTSRV
jgi:hypothetical protein